MRDWPTKMRLGLHPHMCSEEAHGMDSTFKLCQQRHTICGPQMLAISQHIFMWSGCQVLARFLEWSLVTSKKIAQQNLPLFSWDFTLSSMFLGLYRCRFWQLAFGRGLPAEPEASGLQQLDVRQCIKLYWCMDFSPWFVLTVAVHIFSHLFTSFHA